MTTSKTKFSIIKTNVFTVTFLSLQGALRPFKEEHLFLYAQGSISHVPIIQSTCSNPSRSFPLYIQLWLLSRHVQSLGSAYMQCQALKIWRPRQFPT